jgi:hypothetical protein
VITRVDSLGPGALGLAQALAVLGDGCELRHAAAVWGVNREIAGELYVTLKAVEGHLARAYAKLGIQGRDQLPRALGSGKDWGADPAALAAKVRLTISTERRLGVQLSREQPGCLRPTTRLTAMRRQSIAAGWVSSCRETP